MPLRVGNTEIEKLYVDGKECSVLYINDVAYFGKKHTLSQSSSTGVAFSVRRNSSPYQRAETGYVSTGRTIHYGDEITISVSALYNYVNPKLYVDTGGGASPRSSPYTFTVTGDVVYYGTAQSAAPWETLWTGTKTCTWDDSLTISGLSSYTDVEIVASAVFEDVYIDPDTEEEFNGHRFDGSCYRQRVPLDLRGCNAYIRISISGDKLVFKFCDGYEESKGYILYEMPTSFTITEVRGR